MNEMLLPQDVWMMHAFECRYFSGQHTQCTCIQSTSINDFYRNLICEFRRICKFNSGKESERKKKSESPAIQQTHTHKLIDRRRRKLNFNVNLFRK